MTKIIPEHQQKRIREIGILLKNWRRNEGLTQVEFSQLAEIHPNSQYHIENHRIYSIITLLKCIDATGLTLSEFFDGIE